MNPIFRRFFTIVLVTICTLEIIIILRYVHRRENVTYIDRYSEFESQERMMIRNTHYNISWGKNENKKRELEHPTEVTTSQDKENSIVLLLENKKLIKREKYTRNEKIDQERIEDNRGKVNIYCYADICSDYDNFALLWNKLFPNLPEKYGMLTGLEENRKLCSSNSRIIGYISPSVSGYYEFEISSRQGCELIIMDEDQYKNFKVIDQFMLRLGLYKEEIISRLKADRKQNIFTVRSNKTIFMKTGNRYLFDLTNSIPISGQFVIKWRHEKDFSFQTIPSHVLSPFDSNVNRPLSDITIKLPNIRYFQTTNGTTLLQSNRRNFFDKMKLLNIPVTMETCEYKPTYVPNNIGKGSIGYVKLDLQYPYDVMIAKHVKEAPEIFMQKEKAEKVIQEYMRENLENYTLQHIVNMEENDEKIDGKRYFIEVDVQHKQTKQLFRASSWIHRKNDGQLCTPKGYTWNPQEKIYLLTPVKNQYRWIKDLVQSLNEVVISTNEKNIHLIMVDYNSTDVVLEDVLQSALFPYTLIKQTGKFTKTKGLNIAVNSIKEDDALMFVYDLQLDIPRFLFDSIRKHTFRSRTTYVPILLRAYCGQHPRFTEINQNSIWQEIGYGMIAIFKSDWIKVGGMDEEQFSYKWGGEDWEFIERITTHQLEVLHHRLPGYYHLHHSTKGTWDGSKTH